VIAVALSAGVAAAHGPSEMRIGSTADGGGALAVDFSFDAITPVAFVTEVAGTSVYAAEDPSLDAIVTDDPAASRYVLDDGTEVRIEVTSLEPGTTALKVNGTVLDAVGESAVIATFAAADPAAFHRHPEWQLLLALPAGGYGSGTIAFKLTTTSPSYAASPTYTLTLSNGQLPAVEFDSAAYDKKAIACRAAIAKAVRTFAAAEHQQLAKCLDKIEVVNAIEAAIGNSAKAAGKAAAACGDALVTRVGTARRKAVDAVAAKCAGGGLGAEAIAAHVGFAACQTEALIAASYPGAKALRAAHTAGGRPTDTAFPCL
jgi:hypothetical protein